MKKVLIVMLVTLFGILISSCSKESDESQYTNEKAKTEEWVYEDIEFEIEDYPEELYEGACVYEVDVIPDKETAIAVAAAIFNSMEKSSYAETFEPQVVSYDEEKEIWVVTFFQPIDSETQEVTAGYDCSIALQKKDGRVLRIWFC